jgi:hypothetical protein
MPGALSFPRFFAERVVEFNFQRIRRRPSARILGPGVARIRIALRHAPMSLRINFPNFATLEPSQQALDPTLTAIGTGICS